MFLASHCRRLPAEAGPGTYITYIVYTLAETIGRPKATFRHTHEHMVRRLGKVGEEKVDPQQWLGSGMYESAQDRVSWRASAGHWQGGQAISSAGDFNCVMRPDDVWGGARSQAGE